MKKYNILTYNSNDLVRTGVRFEDIEIEHFRGVKEDGYDADVVIYTHGDKVKILKNKPGIPALQELRVSLDTMARIISGNTTSTLR